MDRIRTIIDKEWAEVFKNRMVLFTIVFLPLIFTALPLIVLSVFRSTGEISGDMADMPAQFAQACGNVSPGDCMQIYVLNQFLIMFMIMPMAIPVAIAAYSIVGEKTTHSLEPLLATPISTAELMTGKALAAALPAVGATWLSFFLFVLIAPLVGASAGAQSYYLGSTWLTGILLIGPLMAVLAVIFALIVSSRVSDPRVAEQVSMVIIVPLLAVMFGQIGGILVINTQFMLIASAVLLVSDIALIFLGVRFFQRETILTKWK
jgi:ABC-2 type transport system permease protein